MQPTGELTGGFASCLRVANGFRKLSVLGGPAAYTFFCFNDRSYLAVNVTTNFAEIAGAKTSFCAIRVDPASLQVDVGDFTFANTTFDMTKRVGQDATWSIATTAPYGFAAACQDSDYLARASIDLNGTAFMISSNVTFGSFGANPSGSVSVGASRQLVSLEGGGFCGWSRASPNPPRGVYYEAKAPLCAQFGWDLALWPAVRSGNPANEQARPCGLFRSTCEIDDPLPTCAELALLTTTTIATTATGTTTTNAATTNAATIAATTILTSTAPRTTPSTTTSTTNAATTTNATMLSDPSSFVTSHGGEVTLTNEGLTTPIAIACGVSAAVLLLAAVLACVLCRRKKRDTQQSVSASAMTMPAVRSSEYGSMSGIQSTSAIDERDPHSHYGSSALHQLN